MTTNPPPSPWQRPQPPGQPGPPPPPGYGPTGPPQHPPFPQPRPAGAWAPGTPPLAPHVTGYPQWAPQRRQLRPRPALWIGLSAAVVGVGGLVVVLLAVFSKTVLDNTAVAKGVRTILTTSYGFADTDVQEVTCPPDQPIEPGHRFICTAVISGTNTPITVTVRNKAGEYEVAHP